MSISACDIASVSLPDRGKRGWLVMIECYLDDSGTHQGSPVVVWGGVAGDKYYIDQLDAAWRARLLQPCDGKPAIKAFHSYDLEHGEGQFRGYNQAERDLTRRNFRQVIINAGVSVLSYGVSVKDWDRIVRGFGGHAEFTAEQSVFGKAIFDIAKAAKADGEALSLQFDQGRDTPHLREVISPTLQTAEYEGRFVSYGFSPVADVPALQAADLVVHESFRAFKQLVSNPTAVPRPHALQLFEGAFAGAAQWMGRKEIKDTVRRIERSRKRADKRAKKGRAGATDRRQQS